MAEQVITVKDMVEQNAERFKDFVAFQMKRDEEYKGYTFREVGEIVQNLMGNLVKLGVAPGDRVALLSENRPEWALSYLSLASMGAVIVPLDALRPFEELANLVKDSGSKAIILSGKFMELLKNRQEFPELKFIISMDTKEDRGHILSFERLAKTGVSPYESKVGLKDLASIIYTSGTTGVAKGVMLTQENVMSNVLGVSQLFDIGPGDNFLSVLPLHHTFETTAGFLGPFYMGAKITYAESLKSYNLIKNMQETQVTIMCGVPLLYQLFYEGIKREIEEKGKIAEFLFKTAPFIFRKIIMKKLGGTIRFWVSGGAAIDPEVIHGFKRLGIIILQGYGLTESAPILACCTLKNNRIGSVGQALPGVEVKISKDGEIIARGPNIMKGYYKKPEATAETVKEGWLHTGDVGYIDKDGYVFITGRLKDVIVTGAGVNVYPEELEFILNRIPFIKESCILGTKVKAGARKGMEEILALILPDMEYFEKYKIKGIEVNQAFIKRTIEDEIHKINEKLPPFKRMANVQLRLKEFPKTSTRKIKRYVVRKELGL